jgi:dipeptidyl aminopeptidase/acylaminoacyl peptidase
VSDEIQAVPADAAAPLAVNETLSGVTPGPVEGDAPTAAPAPASRPLPPVTVPVTHEAAPLAPAAPVAGPPLSLTLAHDPSNLQHPTPPAPRSAPSHDISALMNSAAANGQLSRAQLEEAAQLDVTTRLPPLTADASRPAVAAAPRTAPLAVEIEDNPDGPPPSPTASASEVAGMTPAEAPAAPEAAPGEEPAVPTSAAVPAVEESAVEAAPAPEAPIAPTPAAPETDKLVALARDDPNFTRYYAVRAHIGPIAFSPDMTQVAYITNASGQFNIWRQAVTGGWASQVTTFEDESARSLIWATENQLIAAADGAGNEQYDLFTIPATGGAPAYITSRPDAQYELSEEGLSPDGRTLAYSGNDRTPTDSDVLLRDLTTGKTRRALANGRFNVAINWSPDGRYIAVMDIRSNTDMRLWLLDTHDDSLIEVAPGQGERYIAPGPWLPDSSGLYVITDHGREYKGIGRYLLATGEMEWVVATNWDVEQIALSADGRRLLWTLNESGRSQLHLRDGDQASLRVSGLPIGVIEYMKLTPDGQRLALRINSSTAPAEVYILTLGAVGMLTSPHLRRLTFGMLGGLEPAELTAPDLVSYRSHDGRDIPAWLYRPRGAAEGKPAPLVIAIHGGPEAQERVEYRAFYQYLLSRGIGVLAPNIRGSTGYGKAYQKLIHRDWGGAELKDIQSTAEYARSLHWVDGARLGVFGGSFGGFATLSAVTRLPDYWAAGVDIVGPSNLLTFVRSVPPTWRRMMATWVGDPDEDADLLRERSPITYVEQIRAPLLVLQGANDPRVAKAESDQMVERLRALGRDVEYVVFPDEGHGFTKRVNTLRGYRLAASFFQKHLIAK